MVSWFEASTVLLSLDVNALFAGEKNVPNEPYSESSRLGAARFGPPSQMCVGYAGFHRLWNASTIGIKTHIKTSVSVIDTLMLRDFFETDRMSRYSFHKCSVNACTTLQI